MAWHQAAYIRLRPSRSARTSGTARRWRTARTTAARTVPVNPVAMARKRRTPPPPDVDVGALYHRIAGPVLAVTLAVATVAWALHLVGTAVAGIVGFELADLWVAIGTAL